VEIETPRCGHDHSHRRRRLYSTRVPNLRAARSGHDPWPARPSPLPAARSGFHPAGGNRMTSVRRPTPKMRSFISSEWEAKCERQARLDNKRLAEAKTGKSILPRRLDTYCFCRHRCKCFHVASALRLPYGADASWRRVQQRSIYSMYDNDCTHDLDASTNELSFPSFPSAKLGKGTRKTHDGIEISPLVPFVPFVLRGGRPPRGGESSSIVPLSENEGNEGNKGGTSYSRPRIISFPSKNLVKGTKGTSTFGGGAHGC
jgi:hypothetical protein